MRLRISMLFAMTITAQFALLFYCLSLWREVDKIRLGVDTLEQRVSQNQRINSILPGDPDILVPSHKNLEMQHADVEERLAQFDVPSSSSRFLPRFNSSNTDPKEYFEDPSVRQLCISIARKEKPGIFKALKSNVNVNAVGSGGTTPLLWALGCKNLCAFDTLLEHGADPDSALTDYVHFGAETTHLRPGETILSASMKDVTMHKFFLSAIQHSRDVNRRFEMGNSLLMEYVSPRMDRGGTSLILPLIQSGVNLDLKNHAGQTALHLSVSNPEICRLLLESGASPFIKDDSQTSFADLIETKSSKTYRALRNQFTSPENEEGKE